MNDLFKLLEIVYIANADTEKTSYKAEIVGKLRMIDFYIYVSFHKKIISSKQYTQVGNFLDNIVKEIIVWLKNETTNQSI